MTAVEFMQFGQLPAIRLCAPDGAQATVCLFGAHVVSWIPAAGTEQLFCSAHSVLDGTKAIRGGIPVIFPQFSERGDGIRHGFARIANWHLIQSGVDNGVCFAELALSSEDDLPAIWLHEFALTFRVAVHGSELALTLHVRNTGKSPFSFATALHTYFLVDDIAAVTIEGLQHTAFWDQMFAQQQRATQSEHLLTRVENLDRIYYQVPSDLALSHTGTQLALRQEGFVDAVVWNPGTAAASMSDLGADEFRRFVCIEPACIEPCRLEPGKEWRGCHRIRLASPIS